MNKEEHERLLIRSFIIKERQNRYIEFLSRPKRRKDLTKTIAHFKHLDLRFVVPIPPHQRHVSDFLKILKAKGAPKNCYVISESDEMDGKEMPLLTAFESVVGQGMGTFLSCLPGRLAYFEDEDQRWILERVLAA